MSEYKLNPDTIPVIMDWLTPDGGDELSALKHQTKLYIESLCSQLAQCQQELTASDTEWTKAICGEDYPINTPKLAKVLIQEREAWSKLDCDYLEKKLATKEAACQSKDAEIARLVEIVNTLIFTCRPLTSAQGAMATLKYLDSLETAHAVKE